MIERPILFNGRMVKRVLDETKTQTRRLVTPQPHRVDERRAMVDRRMAPVTMPAGWEWRELYAADGHHFDVALAMKSPYGIAGDRLWVRETWYCDNHTERDFARARIGWVSQRTDEQIIAEWRESMYYRADTESGVGAVCELIPECQCEGQSPWKPAIHMPRWASRITLEVARVRAEQLQSITEDDAKAEGVEPVIATRKAYPSKHAADVETKSYRLGFARLWDEINGERASWASNPWVWAVDFKLAEVRE